MLDWQRLGSRINEDRRKKLRKARTDWARSRPSDVAMPARPTRAAMPTVNAGHIDRHPCSPPGLSELTGSAVIPTSQALAPTFPSNLSKRIPDFYGRRAERCQPRALPLISPSVEALG